VRRHHSLLALGLGTALAGCSGTSLFTDYGKNTVGSLSNSRDWPEAPALAVEDSRQAAMQEYEGFLRDASDDILVPEAMRRLADLHLAQEQDDIMLGAQQPEPGKSRAAELYSELLERFPDHPHNDNALYQMARALEQNGDPEPAMKALSNYADRFAGTDKYDEVQFRRGEYLFVRRDYREAETAYRAVLEHGESSVFYQQALYKTGWALFKQNDYLPALDAYMELLDKNIFEHSSAQLPETLERADRERVDDTLRAVSLSFSYLGGKDEISQYFDEHGHRHYEPLIYANLATLYLGKERFTDAAETYRMFASVHPNHREAPLFQSRVIDVYKQAGFSERVLAEKQAFVESYEPASEYWKQHNVSGSPEVLNQVQRHLRDIAQHYHAQAQKEKKAAAYAEAGRWYQLYLRSFRESEQAPYMNFLYAELLTGAGQHDRAAYEYEQTAYSYEPHDKASEAGYAALLAYRKHETGLKGSAALNWHRAGIRSALRFAGEFPEHQHAMPVRTRAAQELYALKDYPAAISAAQPVVDAPTAPRDLQLAAWTVIAHAQFDLEDYQRAEAAYQQVLARTDRKDEQRGALEEKLAASIYKQGEQEKAAGNLAGAAEHFLRIAGTVPGSSINVTAQYDAAAAYIALQQWPDAIRILEQWRKDNTGHELQADVTRKLAALYQENGQPLLAASEFQRIAATEKDPALRREAAWTTATLYQQAGRLNEAIAAYKLFVKQFPHPVEQSMEGRHQLVLLHDKANAPDKKRYWQMQIIEADRSAGSQRSDRTRFLAASARLSLVEDDHAAYRRVRLQEPLQKNLARKKEYMQAAIKGYNEAAAYKVAQVTTEATFHIGELYTDFSQALMESERPRNLNAEELEQYEILLEEQAFPFEEKAIQVHETNAARIADGLYDEWVRDSMSALAALMPARYAKEEKSESFVAVLQ